MAGVPARSSDGARDVLAEAPIEPSQEPTVEAHSSASNDSTAMTSLEVAQPSKDPVRNPLPGPSAGVDDEQTAAAPSQWTANDRQPVEATASQVRVPLPEVSLKDLSAVTYESVGNTIADPPGAAVASRSPASRPSAGESVSSHLAPSVVEEMVDSMTASSTSVRSRLDVEPVEFTSPEFGSAPGSYTLPSLDGAFRISGGEKEGQLRTLDFACPGSAEEAQIETDPFDRLELARLMALCLLALHDEGLVTTGVDWDTFVFTTTPHPQLALARPDLVRPLGGEFLRPQGRSIATPGGPFDGDRTGFARLSEELLLVQPGEGHNPERTIVGVTVVQDRRLHQLWDRGRGLAGTRPSLREWVEVLCT